MPSGDFTEISKKIDKVFPTGVWKTNACDSQTGSCILKYSCEEVAKKEQEEGIDYSLTLMINGFNDKEM